MPRTQMGPHAAAIYNLVYYIIFFSLFLFVFGSIAFEIRILNAIKKCTYFVSLVPLLPSRTQVSGAIFYISVEQVEGKTSDPGTC